ncbi:MAG: MAPEG family protein [Sphingomicrobium sp.]
MTPIPVTLLATAAAVALNIWLGYRIVKSRRDNAVKIGDGGNEAVLRRMRAQANFIENGPFFLILLGGLELSGASRLALGAVAAAFILARIAHPIGMDGPHLWRWRTIGMITSVFALIVLAIWALMCAGGVLLGG